MKLLDLPFETPSNAGKRRLEQMHGEPLLVAAWEKALMLHYAVDAHSLQAHVPFPLDLQDGLAYVSLVAFTMRDMRFRKLGNLGRWLLRPIATHKFLNVRTYVTHRGEPGIYFLSEWLPNRLSVALGKPVFGLPYRHGKLHYHHDLPTRHLQGSVSTIYGDASLEYHGEMDEESHAAPAGSLDEFLLERYTAFTRAYGADRLFRVWHPAWQYHRANVRVFDRSLMHLDGTWADHAGYIGATYSEGFQEVWMSRPRFA